MDDEKFGALLQFFKVLGNESRLKILGLLANQERSVGELATLLELKEPTVSHHLAMMKKLGLVNVQAEGNMRIYQLQTSFLESMSADIFSQDNLATLVDETAGDSWEQKVLRTFIEDNRVKQIPVQYKKKKVLLRWMLQNFETEKRYTEREVNDTIKQYHPDSAWFRRAMVDEKMMAREKGIYWRLPEANTL